MVLQEIGLEHIQHEHPLNLIDLHLQDEDYEQDSEYENDLIIAQDFSYYCDSCNYEIRWLHRYYYKCSISCNYSIHKHCGELSITLQHPSHPIHNLILNKHTSKWRCHKCHIRHFPAIRYSCFLCDIHMDITCALIVVLRRIHHPSHPHPLLAVNDDPILCKCSACGKKHEGKFFHCTTCFEFSIHLDCASLPIKLLLKNDYFSHTHPLTLSYSFLDLRDKHEPKCRICGISFSYYHWLYKCEKCRYYVHVGCATSREEPFMSIFLPAGMGKTLKNFNDDDYPHLLHLPFNDESCNIIQHRVPSKEDFGHSEQIRDENGLIKHFSHEHPLVRISAQYNDGAMTSTSRINSFPLHNPMKKIQLLCNGCVRPITTMPFYKCSKEDECGNIVLHERCTQLPTKLRNHPSHPQHTLIMPPNIIIPPKSQFFLTDMFPCAICKLYYNGLFYFCPRCNFYIDVNCAFLPEKITHEAHANHLLSRIDTSRSRSTYKCHACHFDIYHRSFFFGCSICDFYLHPKCALFLPRTIRHKHDKHPLNLSYAPIENHKSEYFCEICEEELNPELWFYHCLKCGQSMHTYCAPLMVAPPALRWPARGTEGVYKFVNIK